MSFKQRNVMPTFNSIKELTRALQQGTKLLNDMFIKRKTVSVQFDDAVETLEGDENKLKYLINYGVIVQSGDTLELDDAYQRFFEEVLAVNEDINVASVQTFISKLNLAINSYLATDSPARRIQLLKDIRHTFKSIENATRRNVVDLKRNVEQTYKQEPDFKIKELRLKDFDEKAKLIDELIKQTEKVMDVETIFFANASTDIGLKQTVSEVKEGLHESAHSLIAISSQIIDYLNRIEYQSKLVKKIRKLKYLKDQFMIEESTDIKVLLNATDDLWMEKQPKYITRVSLDFLRNDDQALDILQNIRKRLSKKTTVKVRLADKIDDAYLTEKQETSRIFNHAEIMNAFFAQGKDLFNFIWEYEFSVPADSEMRLVLFLQLASQYDTQLRYTSEIKSFNNIDYPLIYSK